MQGILDLQVPGFSVLPEGSIRLQPYATLYVT